MFARRGRVLDRNGNDVYLPNVERLSLPILFIHGAKNACFAPESTARTLQRLAQANGRQLYERHVIPDRLHLRQERSDGRLSAHRGAPRQDGAGLNAQRGARQWCIAIGAWRTSFMSARNSSPEM